MATRNCINGHENDINAVFCETCGMTFIDDIPENSASSQKYTTLNANSNEVSFFKTHLTKIISAISIAGLLILGYTFLLPKLSSSLGSSLSINDKAFLTISGSNTMGEEMMPELAKAYMETKLNLKNVSVSKSNNGDIIVSGQGVQGILTIKIETIGSEKGINKLLKDSCDIAMSSREIKDGEITETVNHSINSEYIIARDGLAVIVNEENPIQELSKSDLADIFSGQKTEWAEFGNYFGTITILALDQNSSTTSIMETLILNQDVKKVAPDMQKVESIKDLLNGVAKNKFAIAYVSSSKTADMKNLKISGFGMSPIAPSIQTLSTEDYPISRRMYLYANTKNKGENVQKFLEFCNSSDAFESIKKMGFIPNSLECSKAMTPVMDSSQASLYRNLYKGNACRLTTTLFFNNRLNQLDNKGLNDISRILAYQSKNTSKSILLCGFANASGNQTVDIARSETLISIVKKEFESKGVRVESMAVGSSVLVAGKNASNQNKNNRIEVWMK
jgi:phosphate transport system substrate-binding protein